ncbi:MAG: alpha-L-fucosidase [Rhizobium sp.]|nr:alpha-L-fucosidase [Rhizobium sp.]
MDHNPFSTSAHREALFRIEETVENGPYAANWASLHSYGFPDWYVDGKFGIFIHWGPSSVAGYHSDWYAREMYREGTKAFQYHLETFGKHDEVGYKDLIPRYTMENFEPDRWASLFRQAGAQFVVPLAEYHDGFAEYDSSFTPYKATAMGPNRDLLGDLFSSLRKVGITTGCSSHYAENWWFFNGGVKFPSDVQDPAFAALYGPAQREELPANHEFMKHWLCRTCDFVEKYRPSLVWFDGCFNGIEQKLYEPYLKQFAAFYFNRSVAWGQKVAINYKHFSFPDDVGVRDYERGQLSDITHPFWQTDTAMARNTWIYIRDAVYKDAEVLIGDLVDIVSKNGALLLNIGPKPDGTIPEPEVARLEAIGRWLAVNGEAIYHTRPWTIFGEGPSRIEEGHFTDTHRQAYTSKDIRFTQRNPERIHDEILYATVLAWPDDDRVLIRSLADGSGLHTRGIRRIDLLGGPSDLEWTRNEDGLSVILPPHRPSEVGLSLRLYLEPRRAQRRHQNPTHEHGPSYDE